MGKQKRKWKSAAAAERALDVPNFSPLWYKREFLQKFDSFTVVGGTVLLSSFCQGPFSDSRVFIPRQPVFLIAMLSHFPTSPKIGKVGKL